MLNAEKIFQIKESNEKKLLGILYILQISIEFKTKKIKDAFFDLIKRSVFNLFAFLQFIKVFLFIQRLRSCFQTLVKANLKYISLSAIWKKL